MNESEELHVFSSAFVRVEQMRASKLTLGGGRSRERRC